MKCCLQGLLIKKFKKGTTKENQSKTCYQKKHMLKKETNDKSMVSLYIH